MAHKFESIVPVSVPPSDDPVTYNEIGNFYDILWDAFIRARLVANHDPAIALRGFYNNLASIRWTTPDGSEKYLPSGQLYFHITNWLRNQNISEARRNFAAEFNGDKLLELHRIHNNAVETFTDEPVGTQTDGCAVLATQLIGQLDKIRIKHNTDMDLYNQQHAVWVAQNPFGAAVQPWTEQKICNNYCPICSECNDCCSRDINSNWHRVETRYSGLGCHPACTQYGGPLHVATFKMWQNLEPKQPEPPVYPDIQIGACINCPINVKVNGENDLLNKIHMVTNCHADVNQSIENNEYAYHPLTSVNEGEDYDGSQSRDIDDSKDDIMSKINKPIMEGYPVTWMHVLIIILLVVIVATFWPKTSKKVKINPSGSVGVIPPS